MDIRNGLITAYNGISASLGTSNQFNINKSGTNYLNVFNNGRLWIGSGTPADAGFQADIVGTVRMSGNTVINGGDLSIFKSTLPILNVQDQTGVNNGYQNFTATLWSSSPLTTILNVWGKTAISISSWNFNNTGYTTTTLNATPGLTSANGGHTLVMPLNTNIQKGITFVRPDNILTTNNCDAITISSATFGTYKFFRLDDIGNTYSRGSATYGSETINASAILQADSTTKGFLPPRMTNAQRTAISSPAVGLIVYCTDATEGLYVYKSTGWTFIV